MTESASGVSRARQRTEPSSGDPAEHGSGKEHAGDSGQQTPKPSNGLLTTYNFNYNWLGQKTYAFDPDTGETRYTYNARGNIATVDDATSNSDPELGIIQNTYDVLGRQTSRKRIPTDSSATTLATWDYDNDATGANGLGKLWKTSAFTKLGTFGDAISAYDERGNALSVTESYPASLTGESGTDGAATKTTTFTYNQLGQAVTTNLPAVPGIAAMTLTTNVGRAGIFTGMAGGGKAIASADYDNLNRPVTLTSKSLHPQAHLCLECWQRTH